jgi:hypothetical protein
MATACWQSSRNEKREGRVHPRDDSALEDAAMLYTILIVILVLALIVALPAWPYSAG